MLREKQEEGSTWTLWEEWKQGERESFFESRVYFTWHVPLSRAAGRKHFRGFVQVFAWASCGFCHISSTSLSYLLWLSQGHSASERLFSWAITTFGQWSDLITSTTLRPQTPAGNSAVCSCINTFCVLCKELHHMLLLFFIYALFRLLCTSTDEVLVSQEQFSLIRSQFCSFRRI